MSREPVDLNHLRDLINGDARSGAVQSAEPLRRVQVDPEGAVVVGRPGAPSDKLSEVHPGVFAAGAPPAAQARVVAEKLPATTRWVEDDKARGWMYDITNELGDDYCFFIYHRPERGLFFAMMVYPEVPVVPNPHVAHYFRSGGLCLAPEVGLPTLEACYAKTVIFSIGWSTYVRVGEFPFAGA